VYYGILFDSKKVDFATAFSDFSRAPVVFGEVLKIGHQHDTLSDSKNNCVTLFYLISIVPPVGLLGS